MGDLELAHVSRAETCLMPFPVVNRHMVRAKVLGIPERRPTGGLLLALEHGLRQPPASRAPGPRP